jgi:acetylornithine deacetylase/succinyl-diaminopimelate desuccinylase-like protein
VTRLLEDLVALAGTPAPTFAEEPRLRWLEQRLSGRPGERDRDRAGNLVWSWGQGKPRLVLAAHVDTVFSPDSDLTVREDGDDLVGPGVGDNAAAVAVAVGVVEALLTEAELAPGAVAFTVGEEGLGNLRGATEVCRSLAPEAFIALEGHGLDEVLVEAVGSVRARVEVRGPGGHSWEDRGAPSAIGGLLGLAEQVRALDSPVAPVNIGTIEGGRSINTIADGARMLVERRALEQEPLDQFTRLVESLELATPLQVDSQIVGRRPAGRLDASAPLLVTVLAVRERLGLPLALGQGSSDANAALAAGIPALCLGVARGSGMHSHQERISHPSLSEGARLLEGVLRALLRAEAPGG